MNIVQLIKKDWLSFSLLIIPFVLAAILWKQLPASLAVQFSFSGEVNRYDSKGFFMIVMAAISIFTYGLLLMVPYIDPKPTAKYVHKPLSIIRLTMAALLCIIMSAILLFNVGISVGIGMLGKVVVPIVLLVVGNLFSKLRTNYFVGIRTPWTLENEEVWVKTHRMAGGLWVASALFMLMLAFSLPDHLYPIAVIVLTAIMVLVPIVYSYLLFQKLKTT